MPLSDYDTIAGCVGLALAVVMIISRLIDGPRASRRSSGRLFF
ncbi:hypothetical protein [Enterovirga aerilata]|nr:hypothetical protein [Enterovirga sp. DB1703]